MGRGFFSFPNPVNEVAARAVAAGVVALAAVAIGTGALWLTVLLAYGFVARALTGPRLSPLGQIATRLVAPRLSRRAKYTPGPPKRFAQSIGAAFTLAAMSLWLAGQSGASEVVLGALLIPATLEAGLGYCVGCQVFRIGMRLGLVPDSVCAECADLWGTRARRELAAD